MSKMSELHRELTEQANELGFESLDEALSYGYVVGTNHKLVKDDNSIKQASDEWELNKLTKAKDNDIEEKNIRITKEEIKQAIQFVLTHGVDISKHFVELPTSTDMEEILEDIDADTDINYRFHRIEDYSGDGVFTTLEIEINIGRENFHITYYE